MTGFVIYSDKWFIESFEAGLPIERMSKESGRTRKEICDILSKHGYKEPSKKSLDEEAVCSEYLKEESTVLLVSAKFKCNRDSVLRILYKNDVPLKKREDIDLDPERVASLYDSGLSLDSIGDIFGCSSSPVRRVLTEQGIKIRTVGESQQKYKVDENFFLKINSEEKAYWLGFMFADGYVKSNMRDFGITLASIDRDHLYKFAKSIKYDGPIHSYSQATSYGDTEYSRIVIASRKSCSSLIDRGCLPRKTHNVEVPNGVPPKYIRDFVRGVVDGDGYIGVYNTKNGHNATVELVGSRDLLEWIKSVGPDGMSDTRPHKSIYRIRTTVEGHKKWIDWLYKDATVYLDRKYKKAEEMFQ